MKKTPTNKLEGKKMGVRVERIRLLSVKEMEAAAGGRRVLSSCTEMCCDAGVPSACTSATGCQC